MSAGGGTKAVIAALMANLAIAVAKFVAWALTGASSMLAEGIHSVADSGNQVLLLVGGSRSRRAPTKLHPFGYGRSRYLYAFMVAIVLFSLGGLFALYEAYHKWHEVSEGHPNELLEGRWWWVPLVVLGFAIVAESMSFRTAIHETSRVKDDRGWWEFIRTAKAPELPVILLEDLAALIGLVLALAGVGLTLLTGNAMFDVAGTACIGVLLVCVAVVLAMEMTSLLLGESAAPRVVRRIEQAIVAAPGIERLIHLRTLHIGPEELLVAAKVGVGRAQTAAEIADAIDSAERSIRAAEPMATTIYLEPDLYREGRTAGTAGSQRTH